MHRFFVAGPLAQTDILQNVSGTSWMLSPFTLTGFSQAEGAVGSMPGMMRSRGKALDGQILTCNAEEAERLTYFARCFRLQPEIIETDEWEVTVFLSSSNEEWEAWDKTQLPLLAHATLEIMRYFGRLEAATVAGRMHMILARGQSRIAATGSVPCGTRSAQSAEDVSLVDNQATHEGFFLTETMRLRHPTFAGALSETVSREVFIATDAAIVLPYDPVRDRVLLVEQFRMGPYGRGDPYPWVLEPVAGRVDPGEEPETTARRECVEEADLSLSDLHHVSSHYCSPGCSTEVFHCYVGLCDLPDLTVGQGGLDTEHEDIRTHVLSFDDALALCRTGEANVGPLVLLLIWLDRERPKLRSLA